MNRLAIRETDELIFALQHDVDEIVNELRGIEKENDNVIRVPDGWRGSAFEWEIFVKKLVDDLPMLNSNIIGTISIDKNMDLYAFYLGDRIDLGNITDYYYLRNSILSAKDI